LAYCTPLNRISFSILILFLSLISKSALASVCDDLEKDISKQKIELAAIQQNYLALDNLLAAKLSMDLNPTLIFNFLLDPPSFLEKESENLARQSQLKDEELLPQEWAGCAKKTLWLELNKEKRKQQIKVNKSKKAILALPLEARKILEEELNTWGAVRAAFKSLNAIEASVLLEDGLVFRESLNTNIYIYKSQLESFISLLINIEMSPSPVNQFWLAILADQNTQKPKLALIELEEVLNVELTLEQAYESLLLSVNEWRNIVMLKAGWLAFIHELASPSVFFEGLMLEIKMAPQSFIDNLSYPFVREYLRSEKESKGTQVLTSWVIQFTFLLVMIFGLIKSAANAAPWLSGIQQVMIKKLESATAHSLVSGFFWMLKPNASWVFILVVANITSMVFPDDWKIIKLIAPLATIYAGFRALRIIIEWGLSRTYTRAGLFLSNHTAEQLILDSRKMTWLVVCIVAGWGLVYATSGAYLIYVVSLFDLIILWFGSWWLLGRHQTAVNKIIHLVLNIKSEANKEKPKYFFNMLNKIAWPLVFVFVHILDVLFSLNQKLMVFDVYRSFSVKLLRVRLESKSEESAEDDEGEPDQSYSDWMLREAPDNLLFDIGDVSSLIEPLKNWFSDKTDENVMVIVGESGSGKSTLVRRLPSLWQESPVKVLDIPSKLTDPQALFNSIAKVLEIEPFTEIGGLVKQDAQIPPQILVIDSAHNLFLAEVGLFDAYKSLLQCMNAHLENVFWVVVMHAPSWAYLNYVFVREQRVSNIYKMPRWSPMDIRKLILSRHHGGRRRLKYNEMLLSAAASSESSSVRAADSRVFNILWEQCGGNPLAAIELWLNAVKVKGRVAEAGVPQRPSTNLLSGLKDDLYFVYTAIVQHSSLSTDEIMLVTHFSEPVVRHALKQGINLGMITRDDSKRYMVDPYWYGTLSGFLHRKNMLLG
jgi:energy-coupling factor transporter ATP-binding protein EcfA2